MYPFIEIFGGHQFPTYFLVISFSCCLGLLWLDRRVSSLSGDDFRRHVFNLAFFAMVGGFIGGRLFHVIYEGWEFYSSHPSWIFMFWRGGFTFYGGAIAAFLSALAYCRYQKISLFGDGFLDLFAPALALTIGLGRLACFFAGCCYGRNCDLPWAVTFPEHSDAPPNIPLHPTQLYSSFGELFIALILVLVEGRFRRSRVDPGSLFYLYMILHGINRIIMEMFRDDDRGSMIYGYSVSTWISAVVITVGATFLFRNFRASSSLSHHSKSDK